MPPRLRIDDAALGVDGAVVAGGAFSIRIVPVMGILFMMLGTAAFFSPGSWGDLLMAAGFGGLHLVFGAIIARHHGG